MNVGDRVRHGGQTGVIQRVITTTDGRLRARIQWDHTGLVQHVDIVELVAENQESLW